jgi:hypothetical protein
MGTASTTKFIKNVAGALTEAVALTTSAGAGDANAIPALNASGVLDASIVNSKTSSAGAGDSGKVVALGATGKIDATMMPTGIGADTQNLVTSEIIATGDLVNVWSDAGTAKVRKADATIAGKEAHGFVLAGAASGAAVDVYFEGSNTGMSGLTPGNQFLATSAGTSSVTAPTGAGNVVQRVGFAVSATVMNFQSGVPITLA